jgi:aspartyl-tRNA synthetase
VYRSTPGELRSKSWKCYTAGWVQTVRKFGAITLSICATGIAIAIWEDLNQQLAESPWSRICHTGDRRCGRTKQQNPNPPTGDIEIIVSSFTVLNRSAVPPFTIQDDTDGGDDLRMKYRYLDLRRNVVKKNLELRYAVNRAARNYLHQQGFFDIETPFLIKSTPEGARDFVVPSRMNPGQFYALPQSPQTFKQLLMVSGYDRYYQVVKCFRDEDLLG